MKVEIEDYRDGPRILIYFMQGHAHAITVAQAIELHNMLDEQIRAVELRNEAVQRHGESPVSEQPTSETDVDISKEEADCRMEKILFAIDSAKTAVEAKTFINAKAWLEEALILVAAAQQRIHQTYPKCGANLQSSTHTDTVSNASRSALKEKRMYQEKLEEWMKEEQEKHGFNPFWVGEVSCLEAFAAWLDRALRERIFR
jgi:hypothetical protein